MVYNFWLVKIKSRNPSFAKMTETYREFVLTILLYVAATLSAGRIKGVDYSA